MNDNDYIHSHNKYQQNFSIITNELINRNDISWGARMLLIFLISKPTDWKVRRNQLAKLYTGEKRGNGKYAIDGWFQELIGFGYIVYTKKSKKDGQFQHRYDVYSEPQETPEPEPSSDEPIVGLTNNGLNPLYTKYPSIQRTKDNVSSTFVEEDNVLPNPRKKKQPKDIEAPSEKKTLFLRTTQKGTLESIAKRYRLIDSQVDTLSMLLVANLNTDAGTLAYWAKTFPFHIMKSYLDEAERRKPSNPGGYIRSLMKKGVKIAPDNEKENRQVAKLFQEIYGHSKLKINKSYVLILFSNGSNLDVSLNMEPQDFRNSLENHLGTLIE